MRVSDVFPRLNVMQKQTTLPNAWSTHRILHSANVLSVGWGPPSVAVIPADPRRHVRPAIRALRAIHQLLPIQTVPVTFHWRRMAPPTIFAAWAMEDARMRNASQIRIAPIQSMDSTA